MLYQGQCTLRAQPRVSRSPIPGKQLGSTPGSHRSRGHEGREEQRDKAPGAIAAHGEEHEERH
eukprot:6895382-Alexandrium_andersonii.AAC.1